MLERVYLRNFRNYSRAEVSFLPGVNLIQGENAQGKTNLLEAVFLLSTGRSFRTQHLSEIIAHGETFFYLEADFIRDGISQTLKLSFDGRCKKLEYNSTSYSHFMPLLGLMPTVLLVPEDIALVAGSPAERRRFLDLHIAQSDPLYVYHIARYYKAMKHRNHLLRQKKTDAIESWEEIMKGATAYIQQKRQELLLALETPAGEALRELSSDADLLAFSYEPSLIKDFPESRRKEMLLGTTLLGPHRDDFSLLIAGKEAKLFASQGQKRCLVASLRLAQRAHLHTVHAAAPLLSIDDFGVHLDEKRSAKLLSMLFGQDQKQVLITSPGSLGKDAGRVIGIRDGQILEPTY